MIICAPTISQMAVEGALRDDWSYANQFHPEFMRRRQLVAERIEAIPTLSWSPTSGGFFAFARVEGCTDSTALAKQLLEDAHVVTIPGAAFGRSGEGCLRLSFGSVSGEDLVEGLDRLRRFF
jgi:aspartate/methionine/tyrosine aminotransferase